MSRVSVIFADGDLSYLKSVSVFLRTSDFVNKVAVKYFDNGKDLATYLEGQAKTNILLTTPELLPAATSNVDSVIILSETQNVSHQSYPALLKYQPLTMLFTNALDTFYREHQVEQQGHTSNANTKVISVYSPIGGSGKTTLAVNLAKCIANERRRVFYLNLELLSSLPLFFRTEGIEDSSEVFYFSKAKSGQLDTKIATLIRQDGNYLDYFNIKTHPQEIFDVNEADVEKIIKALINRGTYDFIIIDLDSSLSGRVLASLKKSHIILWPLLLDVQSFHKTNAALQGYKHILQDDDLGFKIQFVLNRFLGKHNTPPELLNYGFDIPFTLPYVSEWKSVSSGSKLTSHSFFNGQIKELYSKLLEHNRGVLSD